MKVTNRFKGLDLADRVPEELWTDVHNICKGGSDQNHSKGKKKCKKTMSEEALQIAEERRSKKQRRKGKIHPTEWSVPENSKER